MQSSKKIATLKWRRYLFYCRAAIFLCGLLGTIGKLYAQVPEKTVTFEAHNEPLDVVLKRLAKTSGINIGYPSAEVRKYQHVSLTKESRTVQQTLKELLKATDLDYKLVNNMLIVFKKPASQPVKDSLINVSGRVVDEQMQPIDGITVTVQGTGRGTATNKEGRFYIEQVGAGALIAVKGIGYPLQEQPATPNMLYQITKEISSLDEVQVIAYGTTTRRLNTGSVSSVKAADIEKQPISNPILALQGRVPGLFITQATGQPGSGFNILIRGKNSMQQGTQPFFVVDGIPFESGNPGQIIATGSENVNNPFNSLNPSDIESIEVLKDADATSIYGSRGANGVILITTKRGKAGSLNVGFDSYTGWGKVARSLKLMNGEQYRALRRQAFANDSLTPDVSSAQELFLLDTTINNDWQKTLIGNTAPTTNLQLRLSGGNANTQFNAGANYNYQGTVFPGSFSTSRKSLNLSINHTSPNKKFSLSINTAYAYNTSNLGAYDFTSFLNLMPYGFKLLDSQGNLIWPEILYNPLQYIKRPYNATTDFINTGAAISYKILPGLQLKATGGYNLSAYNEMVASPISSFKPADGQLGNASFATNMVRNWSVEPQIIYNRSILNKLKVEGLVGMSWQEGENKKDKLSGSGYTSDALINTIAGAAKVTATNEVNLYRYTAAFSRLSLNWDNTYLLNLNGRRDGSSRFGPDNRFANFASVGAAWIFSQLDFIKRQLPALDYGKLRISYGTSGNDQIGNYKYLDTYAPLTNGYQGNLSLFPTKLYNGNYGWELYRKLDAALELGFLNDRFFLSVDYYRTRSVNQLIAYMLPGQTGFPAVLLNFPGVVQNKGFEFELRGNLLQHSLKWSANINLTVAKNQLIAYPDLANSSDASLLQLGQSLTVYRGLQFNGVDPQTGIYRFIDQNGDGELNTSDYITVGNYDPKFYGGLQNTFNFKGFNLDFLFQFVKQSGRHPIYGSSSFIGSDGNIPTYVYENYWKKPGDQTAYAKPTTTYGTDLANSYAYAAISSAVLTDASFIRLKNVSLGYTFSRNWVQDLHLKSFNLYTEAQNLLTITHYAGPDPEVQSLYILPPLRVIAVGVRVNF